MIKIRKTWGLLVSYLALSLSGSLFSMYDLTLPQGRYALVEPFSAENEEMLSLIETCGPAISITLPEVIQNTILYRPRTEIQVEDFRIQGGFVQQNAGPFDWLTEFQYSRTKIHDTFFLGTQTNLDSREIAGNLLQAKKFRLGTELSVNMDAAFIRNPANTSLPRFSQGTITFRVLQPLLRGLRYGEDTITELASRYELKAVYYDALHNISGLIRETLIAYWNVVHAQQVLVAFKESVKSFENLAEKTQRLIDEDQIARSEINQPLAQLATEQINLKLAEQRLYSNVQSLKFTMGTVDVHCFNDSLLYAANSFPEPKDNLDICAYMERLKGMAVERRLDKKASEIRVDEFAVLVKGAENRKLPRLDVFYDHALTQFKTGDRARNLVSSYNFPFPQRDNRVGVLFSYPIGNNESQGIYRRFKAEWRRQILSTEELSQQIVVEVMDAWMNHIRLQQELNRAKEAVSRFEQLVTDENKRLSEALGSLFNLVEYQTRLTESKLRKINIERDLAENLTNLHFFTGTLLNPGSSLCYIDVGDVTDVPLIKCCQ